MVLLNYITNFLGFCLIHFRSPTVLRRKRDSTKEEAINSDDYIVHCKRDKTHIALKKRSHRERSALGDNQGFLD